MTTSTLEAHLAAISEAPDRRIIGSVAAKEITDALRSKWFWMWTIAFAGLAAFMASVALPGSQVSGAGSFGRTAASLVALAQIIVPLMGLTLGAVLVALWRSLGGKTAP